MRPEDLLKFGLIPEFIGRLPVIATLDSLEIARRQEISLAYLEQLFAKLRRRCSSKTATGSARRKSAKSRKSCFRMSKRR